MRAASRTARPSQADILGTTLTYKIGAPGRHLVHNSLAVLAAAVLVGADLALAALALADFKPRVRPRRARSRSICPAGRRLLIDESYNANPASMRAALALLGQRPVGARGRRIAVLGDMLELGPRGRALHRGLARPGRRQCDRSRVLLRAADARALARRFPPSRRGGYAEDSAALEPQVLSAVGAGDAVMVKGSLGSRMGPIVKALRTLSVRA